MLTIDWHDVSVSLGRGNQPYRTVERAVGISAPGLIGPFKTEFLFEDSFGEGDRSR